MPKRKLTPKEEEEVEDEKYWVEQEEKWEEEHPEEPQSEGEESEGEQTEEAESEPITEEQAREAWEKDLKETKETEILDSKIKILEMMQKQLEESGKRDAELEALKAEVKLKAEWSALLSNDLWEKILRSYVGVINGLKNHMASKSVITITESNGNMNIKYAFFDKNGRPVLTELDDVVGKEE